ncbi:MAG: LacI family DNA-binding transcriptional regulator [Armatimonadetes bacterium]|nr:LacI family DNA-binding transcriptional regulator [Armatimonadota bacterium]
MRKVRPTLRDVGREAGVSVTTASYVLSGSGHAARIGPQTKKRVLAAAKRLGYVGNSLPIALKRGYTDTIVLLVVTWSLASAQAQLLTDITRCAARYGLMTIVNVVSEDEEAVAFLGEIMSLKPFGLLLLWDFDVLPESELTDIAATGLPVVDLLPSGTDEIVSITADREQGFKLGTQHLIALGHERIGLLIHTIHTWRSSSRKLAGYKAALADAGICYDEDLLEEIAGPEFDHGYTGIKALLERRPDVTAVIGAMTDSVAIGALVAAQDKGIKIPDELSIMGYGAHPEGTHVRPQLTSIVVPYGEITQDAIETLITMRQDEHFRPQSAYKPTELIVRGSSGPVRKQPLLQMKTSLS